ncbi:MAG TPA: S49 family peptidase [Vitreimonas sp.]|uniref:S49 family peptidase n=1 Tax=Vitreimonas sp. TaxID=3069702 RepID=UPI002D74D978|nr:S49 family peptidase [Vitreimonas sp.]HYD87120.1 S49 family peptidase [Vitreimonas sp.]
MTMHRIARHAGRPLLLTPDAARELALRALAVNERALQHDRLQSRPGAFFKRLGIAKLLQKRAGEDDDGAVIVLDADAPRQPKAYAPSYAGEPEAEGYGWSLIDGIACIEIEGALLDRGFCSISGAMFWGYDTIAQSLKEAMAEPRVRGVFVRMDSPGGVVAGGLEALTTDIRAMRESGNANGKPIFMFADCMASAAYWIGAQADRIFAPPVGIVGSIGAVIVHEDWSSAIDKAGVVVTPIQFGAKKTDGAWFKPLSEDARADLQAEIDAIGERFVADVTAGRPMLSREAQIVTQAACFMAEHPEAARSGKALGLVDEIAHEAAAFGALRAHVAGASVKNIAPVSASRRAPAPTSAASVEPGAQTETEDMRKTKDARIAAIMKRSAMTESEKLEAIQGILDEETTEAAEEEPAEDEAAAEGEEEETTAEGEDEEVEAEGEEEETTAEGEEEEPKAKAALARAKAILALPEAKGREALAQELAFTAGMTAKTAKKLLAAAPKASGLAGRVYDPKLGAAAETEAGKKAQGEASAIADRVLAAYDAAIGKAPAKS